jgi:hypothetical protein
MVALLKKPEVVLRRYRRHWAIQGYGYTDCRYPDPRLPKAAQRFWETVGLGSCSTPDGGVVATARGQVIGFCRFNTSRKNFWMAGTWVATPYRRSGLASQMWAKVLGQLAGGTTVYATAATRAGYSFCLNLRKQYPQLNFDLDQAY